MIDRNRNLFSGEKRVGTVEIQRVNAQPVCSAIEQGQAGVVMMNHASESRNDAAKQVAQLAAGDEHIVYIQQDLKAIALLGQFLLGGLRRFEVERVVHGHGNLCRDALHELNIRIGNGLRTNPSKTHGAKTVLRSRKRKNGKRANSSTAQPDKKVREARFRFQVADDKRLLRLPDPA